MHAKSSLLELRICFVSTIFFPSKILLAFVHLCVEYAPDFMGAQFKEVRGEAILLAYPLNITDFSLIQSPGVLLPMLSSPTTVMLTILLNELSLFPYGSSKRPTLTNKLSTLVVQKLTSTLNPSPFH